MVLDILMKYAHLKETHCASGFNVNAFFFFFHLPFARLPLAIFFMSAPWVPCVYNSQQTDQHLDTSVIIIIIISSGKKKKRRKKTILFPPLGSIGSLQYAAVRRDSYCE